MASRFIAPTPPAAPPLPPVSAAVKEDLRPQRRVNRGLRTTVKTGLTGVLETGVLERPSAPVSKAVGLIPARKLLLGE